MEDIFYAAVTIFFVAYSIWAIVMMVVTSPTLQERRHNRRLEAIVKRQEAARVAR